MSIPQAIEGLSSGRRAVSELSELAASATHGDIIVVWALAGAVVSLLTLLLELI